MIRLTTAAVLAIGLVCTASIQGDDAREPITVALYRYVPNPAGMEDVIRKRWQARNPGVKVKFVEWDGYVADPTDDVDVFEFDSIMLDYFVRNNFAAPLRPEDINDRDDLYDFAARGSMVDGV